MEIKSDKKIQTKHLKGSRSFFAKEKEKVGLLVGRFEVQGFANFWHWSRNIPPGLF